MAVYRDGVEWIWARVLACTVVAGAVLAEAPARHGSIKCVGGDSATTAESVSTQIASAGLVLDFDARHGVELDENGRVLSWKNRAANSPIQVLQTQPRGREVADSGRPTLMRSSESAQPAAWLRFAQQELVSADEDALDDLLRGQGSTWLTQLAVFQQRVGLPDVNAFWGTLKNGSLYEGLWAGVTDDNRLWWGPRNGLSFGRVDANNPWLMGPKLTEKVWHVVAGRIAAGTGEVKVELFVDSPQPVVTAQWPVNPKANASKFAIGQERDAVEHPGKESFDGDIARFLLYSRPLSDEELRVAMGVLTSAMNKK